MINKREASEIENLYSAIDLIEPKQYGLRYLKTPIYVPPKNGEKKFLIDFSEIGRILNNEVSPVGGKIYHSSTVDVEILRAALFGDFELCILYDYDSPFKKHVSETPEKKNVMKKIASITNNYMTLLDPKMENCALEVFDPEDQNQINAARRTGCKYIITSDYHLLCHDKDPVGITPEAFAKMHNIQFWQDDLLNFVYEPPEKSFMPANHLSFADFMNNDLLKIAYGS